jgi:hypothetical protein
LDAKASCFFCVKVLMQVDLPALDRPTKAISGVSISGKWCNCAAVVRKRAVCIQPMGVTAAGVAGAAGVEVGETRGLELINQGALGRQETDADLIVESLGFAPILPTFGRRP